MVFSEDSYWVTDMQDEVRGHQGSSANSKSKPLPGSIFQVWHVKDGHSQGIWLFPPGGI